MPPSSSAAIWSFFGIGKDFIFQCPDGILETVSGINVADVDLAHTRNLSGIGVTSNYSPIHAVPLAPTRPASCPATVVVQIVVPHRWRCLVGQSLIIDSFASCCNFLKGVDALLFTGSVILQFSGVGVQFPMGNGS